MQINIIDPALVETGGHHLDWCEKLARHIAARFGTRPNVCANKKIKPETIRIVERYATIDPVFAGNPYSRPEKIDPLCGELTLFTSRSRSLAAELGRVPPADIWLWPTLFGYQLSALAIADVTTPVAACIHTPPEFYSTKLGREIWRHGGLAARNAKLKLNLGVTIPELRSLFSPLLERHLSTMPLMVEAVPDRAEKTALHRIGFFGKQHPRKGLHLLPELAARLHAQGYEVIVHDSGGTVHGTDLPGLRYLTFADSLPELIASCDLVILPYDPDAYRSMGSAIAWEAVALGVPVVVPADTSPGRFITDLGAGVTFSGFDVQGICAAVEQARGNYAAIAHGAFDASRAWSQHHGVERFVTAMLTGGG